MDNNGYYPLLKGINQWFRIIPSEWQTIVLELQKMLLLLKGINQWFRIIPSEWLTIFLELQNGIPSVIITTFLLHI